MKNKTFLKFIVILFIYSCSYAGAPITVYNNSNLNMWFESHMGGCSGLTENGCANPWTGAGTGVCCGGTGAVVAGKTHITDATQGGIIGLPDGGPAWTNLYSWYPVIGHAQDGRSWGTNGNHTPGSTIFFPNDFGVDASDLTAMTPTQTLTQTAVATLGYLLNLQNTSSINFTVQSHPISAQSTVTASLWQSPSSKFPDLWDTNNKISISGQLAGLTRTITLSPTAHSLTVQDQIAGQNISPTTVTQLLDLDGIVAAYAGAITSSNIVTGWGVSLKITDQDVEITDVQISYQSVSAGTLVTTGYWIYPDKVLTRTGQATWAPVTGKPTLNQYIHKTTG